MQLWNLCSAKSAVFTGFAGFPCPYLPGKETPLGARVIAPNPIVDKMHPKPYLGSFYQIVVCAPIKRYAILFLTHNY